MDVQTFTPGLYIVRFSYMPPLVSEDSHAEHVDPSSTPASDGGKQEETITSVATVTKRRGLNKRYATQMSDFHVVLRLKIINEYGNLSGAAKAQYSRPGPQKTLGDSASPSGSSSGGAATTSGSGGDVGGDAPSAAPLCTLDPASACVEVSNMLLLLLRLDKLDGSVVGLDRELLDVTLNCVGMHAFGWYAGEVTVKEGEKELQVSRRMRFVCQPWTGARCNYCHDPVYAIGYTCKCGSVDYCGRTCQQEHQKGHHPLCYILHKHHQMRCGTAVAEFDGNEVSVWWRSSKDATFVILVDHTNVFGVPYEITLCTTKDASEGIEVRFISLPKDADSIPVVNDAELNAVNCAVFRAVAHAATAVSCQSLAAACLNALYVYSPHVMEPRPPHLHYYIACCVDQGDSDNEWNISLEEYISYVRPSHELANIMIEGALTSAISLHFWQRLKLAKDVLVNLFNYNATVGSIQSKDLNAFVVDQQRVTLRQLAKVFITMAARAPKDKAQVLLKRAEDCYIDSLQDSQKVTNLYEEGMTYYSLSALYLLFDDPKRHKEAMKMRSDGNICMQKAKANESTTSAGTADATTTTTTTKKTNPKKRKGMVWDTYNSTS